MFFLVFPRFRIPEGSSTNIQIEEPFTSESKIEEVFVQQEQLEEIPKEIPGASNLTNHIKSTAPKEVDTFGKEMEGYCT